MFYLRNPLWYCVNVVHMTIWWGYTLSCAFWYMGKSFLGIPIAICRYTIDAWREWFVPCQTPDNLLMITSDIKYSNYTHYSLKTWCCGFLGADKRSAYYIEILWRRLHLNTRNINTVQCTFGNQYGY